MYECFSCGKISRFYKCPECGYEFSHKDSCPRLKSLKCVHTNKICKVKNYLDCKIFRKMD